jgi:hypothetical protein
VVGADQPGELQRTRRGKRAETFRAPAAGTPPHHAAQGGVPTGDQDPTSGAARQVTQNNQCCGTGTGIRTGTKTVTVGTDHNNCTVMCARPLSPARWGRGERSPDCVA